MAACATMTVLGAFMCCGEFAIRDPNGYTLPFFEETTDPPDCPAP
jgi:hypothetical protein